jgi:hypothetical protein
VVVPAIPGAYKAPNFAIEHFRELRDRVDWFSLMTYDWQGPEPRSNANAPLPWLTTNLETLLPTGGWGGVGWDGVGREYGDERV